MKEVTLPSAHVYVAMDQVAEAMARDTGRHPEWIKRRMREAQKYLADPANDGDTGLRLEYQALMKPVMDIAAVAASLDTDPHYH